KDNRSRRTHSCLDHPERQGEFHPGGELRGRGDLRRPNDPSMAHPVRHFSRSSTSDDQERSADGNRVFEKSDRKVVSADRVDQPGPELISAQGARDAADDARDQPAHRRPTSRADGGAPHTAPVTSRAPKPGGAFRLGVFGSLSATSSASASTLKMYGVAAYPRKASQVLP